MSLQELKALGAFVPSAPIKQTITVSRPVMSAADTWEDPDTPEFTGDVEEVTVDVYMKRLSSADEIAIARADPQERAFVSIFRLVRNEDGTPLFESIEQAAQLAGWMLAPLVQRVEQMAGASVKNRQPPRTTSGSKSHSPSGAEVRKSGKKLSPPNGVTES